jgi:MFS family permease
MANARQPRAGSAFSKKQIFMALAAVFLAYFCYSYFLNAINVAAPRIAADLGGMALYGWFVSIPSLGLALGTLSLPASFPTSTGVARCCSDRWLFSSWARPPAR